MEVEASSCITCHSDLYDRPQMAVDAVCSASNQSYVDVTDGNKISKVTESASNVRNVITENTPALSDSNPKEIQPMPVNTNPAKYRLLRTIGKGNFAKVKLAIHMSTGVELKREITIMKVTNHPHIGEIFDYLVANGKMLEKEARIKFRQLLSAIQYCHAKKIVHRDLKAENILLDKHLNVKVADFGLANTFENDQLLKTFCGSPPYAAPELFLGIPYHGPGVDVWSLGVILFTLVLGHLPFDARDLRQLRAKILGLHYNIPRGAVSPECEALLRKMLVFDPRVRSSLKSLMLDKWINMGYAPNDYLRPYKEPPKSHLDEIRAKTMESMGFSSSQLELSVVIPEFDHVYATYNLLPEIPSQFAGFCEELNKFPQNQSGSLSNYVPTRRELVQMNANPETSATTMNSTAIGRFTVAPSIKTNEVSNAYFQRGSVQAKIPLPVIDSAHNREHHSLTSNFPVAFKRALLQVGRTFGGGNSASPANSTGNAVDIQNSKHGTVARITNRSGSKVNGGTRNVITAAPVPISTVNKKGYSINQQTNKRQTSNQFSVASSSSPSTYMDNPDNNSLTMPTSGFRNVNQHTTPIASNTKQQVSGRLSATLVNTTPRRDSDNKSSNRGPITSDSSHRTNSSITDQEGTNKSSNLKYPVLTQPDVLNGVSKQKHHHHQQQQQPISDNSISSTYFNEYSPDTSAVLDVLELKTVHSPNQLDVANFVDCKPRTSNSCSECVQTVSVSSKETPKSCQKHVDDDDDNGTEKLVSFGKSGSERSEISRSLTHIADSSSGQQPNMNRSIDQNQVQPSSKDSIPNSSIKTLHTIQGNEALALREHALNLRSTNSGLPLSSHHGVTNYLNDFNHQNTWGRGVLRALGGLFIQSKSTELRHDLSSGTSANRALNKPREVRFPWSVHTTSTKSAEELLQAIIQTLEVTQGCRYAYDLHLPFMLQCSWAVDRKAIRSSVSNNPDFNTTQSSLSTGGPGGLSVDDPVHWEMEVCQLPRVHLRGVRLKRIRGSTLRFRPIADLVMKSLRL